ncbi:MAG TPA: CsgG/HfaB family protein, partial [Immundisolibacter sp.]
MSSKKTLIVGLCGIATLALAGCASTQTQLGGGGSMVTGSGGAAGAQGAAPQLTRCATPIGTAALIEQDNPMLAQAGLTSPIPLLRIMMAQSNCFRVVDRGQASEAMQRERAMAAGGDLQSGSNMGAGQMKAADFLITPNVVFKDANAGGGGAYASTDIGKIVAAAFLDAHNKLVSQVQVTQPA